MGNKGVLVACVALALLACKKGNEDGEPAGKSGPVFTKPLAELTQDDVGGACAKVGWSNSGVTSSSSGNYSNIMASCTKESPDGTPSPDGKKRLRMRIAVYKEPADGIEQRKKQLDGENGAYEVQGSHVLAVVLYDKPKDEAVKVLKTLLGK